MKKIGVLILLFFGFSLFLQAQTEITTAEAQTLRDAAHEKGKEVLLTYLLAQAQLYAAIATLCLVFNLRTLTFLFLIVYGCTMFFAPYYISSSIKALDIAIVILSVVGILGQLLFFRKKSADPLKNSPKSS